MILFFLYFIELKISVQPSRVPSALKIFTSKTQDLFITSNWEKMKIEWNGVTEIKLYIELHLNYSYNLINNIFSIFKFKLIRLLSEYI